MIISGDDKWMMNNVNNNSTSLVDLAAGEEREKIVSSLKADAPFGSTPNSIAFNEDESILFIANADNNYLAMFDISTPGHARASGSVPVGWYPTAVRYSPELNKIIVANGKGLESAANPEGPMPGRETTSSVEQYIGTLFKGTVSVIEYPEEEQLDVYTTQVFKNTPYMNMPPSDNRQNVISPVFNGVASSRIKHVFYIIKENRTNSP